MKLADSKRGLVVHSAPSCCVRRGPVCAAENAVPMQEKEKWVDLAYSWAPTHRYMNARHGTCAAEEMHSRALRGPSLECRCLEDEHKCLGDRIGIIQRRVSGKTRREARSDTRLPHRRGGTGVRVSALVSVLHVVLVGLPSTHGVLMGYSRGYSRGTHGVRVSALVSVTPCCPCWTAWIYWVYYTAQPPVPGRRSRSCTRWDRPPLFGKFHCGPRHSDTAETTLSERPPRRHRTDPWGSACHWHTHRW
jgi:hypothetical protein